MGTSLEGRAVVITGAGRGLGRAYALACAAEGAQVLINDRDAEPAEAVVKEIIAGGGVAIANTDPVDQPASARRIVKAAVAAFGAIDVMVTNAGTDRRGPILDLSPEDWSTTLDTHVSGSIRCSIEAGRAMRDRGRGGAIINVTSDAFYMGVPTLGPYCVSKGAIYGLMRVLAVELAPFDITVNAVAPPSTRTGPLLAYVDSLADQGLTPEQLEAVRATIEEPEDVAPIVAWLAGPAARGVTGRVFTMTRNGLTELAPPAQSAPAQPAGDHWAVAEIAGAVEGLGAGA